MAIMKINLTILDVALTAINPTTVVETTPHTTNHARPSRTDIED